MAYIGRLAGVLDGLGCGATCGCQSCRTNTGLGCGASCGCRSCRTNTGLAETYVRDEPDDDDEEEDGDRDDDTARMSGACMPAHVASDHRIAGARERWRPVPHGGMGRYVNPASIPHFGFIAAARLRNAERARLVRAIAACLGEIGMPHLARRRRVLAGCLAGFLAGPEAGASLAHECLTAAGVVLPLPLVAKLLTCVAGRMNTAAPSEEPAPPPAPVRDPDAA
jgi:hypothetical protein